MEFSLDDNGAMTGVDLVAPRETNSRWFVSSEAAPRRSTSGAQQRFQQPYCCFPFHFALKWLNFKTPGIPRTPDSKPDHTAPTPRTADGRPDLSGLWQPQFNVY
jgi:hypothetical protein